MLEYLALKKFKKNKAEREEKARLNKGKGIARGDTTPPTATPTATLAATRPTTTIAERAPSSSKQAAAVPTPILTDDDERFLASLTTPLADDNEEIEEGSRPALPPRVKTPELSWDSDSESFIKPKPEDNSEGKKADDGKPAAASGVGKKLNRLSLFLRKDKTKSASKDKQQLEPSNELVVPEPEADREKDDLTRVLDDLNLSARNNTAFSLSAESAELVSTFTVVLKDLVNGVPTAVNDLTSLLDDSDGKLAKNYEKLPKSLKKLVTQLPEKLSSTLAPELLAVAAEAQGLSKDDAAKGDGGLKGAAKRLLMPKSLSDLVTKPGAIVGMLKGIMNALKLRWPAFIGTNVIWSVALFLLLFVLWYCHKRGKEVRLEREKSEQDAVDESRRIEELPKGAALPTPSQTGNTPIVVEPRDGGATSPALAAVRLPPPPIGGNASRS